MVSLSNVFVGLTILNLTILIFSMLALSFSILLYRGKSAEYLTIIIIILLTVQA